MRSDIPSILVVDDNPQNLQDMTSILTENGLEPAPCQGGAQAINWLKDHDPELALLDVAMPDMDGFTLCRQIKEYRQWANLPVIFLTARTETEDVLAGFEVGAVDYVTKPFNHWELLARVRLHLELKWAKEEIDTLRGILPICSFCKKIRNEMGYWERVEAYISKHSKAEFSHGLCRECMEREYPDFQDYME